MIKLMAKIRFDTPTGEREDTLYHNIVSVDIEALDRGNVTDVINWGIYSNRGSLSFVDRNGTINGMLETLPVLDVKIYVVGNSKESLLATMNLSDFLYNRDTEQVDLELSDKIDEWQTKKFLRYYPFYEASVNNLAREVFVNRLKLTVDEWNGARDSAAAERMANIKVYCPDIQARNVWDAITQLCETAMLRIYSNRYGKPYIACDESVNGEASKPIIIRSRNILSRPNITPRRKTKIESPLMSLTIRTRRIDSELTNIPLEILDVKVNDEGAFYAVYAGGDRSRNPNGTITITKTSESYAKLHFSYVASLPQNSYTVNNLAVTGKIFVYENYVASENENAPIEVTGQSATLGPVGNDDMALINIVIDPIYETATLYMYALQNCLISIIGNYYTDDSPESDEGEDGTTITSNSLMQTHNTAYEEDYGTWYARTIKNRFGSGLVCCELECGFSDYYYENGTIAKQVSNMDLQPQVFDKYEIVIPYITHGGKEVPLAQYDNGNPMKFTIVGIKYHYSGVAKQILYLKEYVEQGI